MGSEELLGIDRACLSENFRVVSSFLHSVRSSDLADIFLIGLSSLPNLLTIISVSKLDALKLFRLVSLDWRVI